ncbi:hypothetical protein PLICRDRAFT_172447 [Plicaturopsis crispa FD-325 SS-3]|nr:hypothetical protein PLICRDRAFT_172447 [Plicaturopsis crispa FD-325 SS-3]
MTSSDVSIFANPSVPASPGSPSASPASSSTTSPGASPSTSVMRNDNKENIAPGLPFVLRTPSKKSKTRRVSPFSGIPKGKKTSARKSALFASPTNVGLESPGQYLDDPFDERLDERFDAGQLRLPVLNYHGWEADRRARELTESPLADISAAYEYSLGEVIADMSF